MTHYEQTAAETEDRFYAQFDSRDVKLMTLDELQTAFEEGLIHERTYVCREGEGEWLTLAVVAGMSDEEDDPEPEQESGPTVAIERRPPIPQRPAQFADTLPFSTPASVESRPPVPPRRVSTPPSAADVTPSLQTEALRPSLAPQSVGTRPPMPQRGPDLSTARQAMPPPRVEPLPQLQAGRPELNTIPATWQASPFPAATPAVFEPKPASSFGPVTSTVSDSDFDDLALRPKRRTGRIVGAVAALGVLATAAAFVLTGGLHSFAGPSLSADDSASKSAASLAAPDVKPSAPRAAPETPSAPEQVAAATPPAATDAPPAASAAPEFTSDMKQALLNADKERKVKQKAKAKAKGRVAPSSVAHHAHAASPAFKSGGSAYDPLNGKL